MNLDYEAATKLANDWYGPLLGGIPKSEIKVIVDAAVPKPCKHGNRERHIIDMESLIGKQWCDGKPEDADE